MKINAFVNGMATALLSLSLLPTVSAQEVGTRAGNAPDLLNAARFFPAAGAIVRPFGQQVRELAPALGAAEAARRTDHGGTRFLDRFDSNGDGAVDEAEFIASRTASVEAGFSRRDTDDDDLLSPAEFQPHPRHDRPELDREALLECVRETIPDYDPAPELEDRFDTIDISDDGFVDELELRAALEARALVLFGRLDTDADGFLSLGEMAAGHQATLNLRRVIRSCIDQVGDPFDADTDL